MEKITYFEITENSDKTEGRGSTQGTGIAFKKEPDALEFCKSPHYEKFAVMGVVTKSFSYHHNRKTSITVYDSFEEYESTKIGKETLRQNALNKLTDADKEILGITI